jgi:hypothetical protein
MTMKQKLAVVALAVAGISVPGSAPAQLARQSQGTPHKQQQVQPGLRLRAGSSRPVYQRRDSWYEFLFKQFNPTNFDYGGWMEERRQVFLNESVRNPYFRYSAGVTLGLLLVTVICAKQWLDHRRTLWITAEMMADLYSHNLYSRDIAEKATRKYNDHIERCNHAIEAGQQGTAIQGGDPDHALCNEKLSQVVAERNEYLRQLNDMRAVLKTKEQPVAELSLRVDGISVKSGSNKATGLSVDLNTADPNMVGHSNNLEEQVYAERDIKSGIRERKHAGQETT